MKTKLLLFTGLFLIGFSLPTEAQIFKKLGKKIEHKIKDRIERKEKEADRKVDQKIDETMDESEKTAGNTVSDWIYGDKEENQEEIDRTTADFEWPMGVGSTDKASAPPALSDNHQVEITGSGSDLHIQYRMDVQISGTQNLNAEMDFYINSNKGARTESVMNLPVIGRQATIVLSNYDTPEKVVFLNEKKKTYFIFDSTAYDEKHPEEEHYTINNLGEEKLYGLTVTHGEATDQNGQIFEFWTSRDLPEYRKMLETYKNSQQMGSDNFYSALIEAGVDGFMVKMSMPMQGGAVVMSLVKIENTTVPLSKISIPEGYKQTKNQKGLQNLFGS